MNQDVQKRRKRTVNFTVGAILAALHAAASANSLMNNSRLEWVSDSALMASGVKAGMIAGGVSLIVTLAAIVLIKRARSLPPVLMILVGNYLCPSLFLMIFQPLFFSAVNALLLEDSIIKLDSDREGGPFYAPAGYVEPADRLDNSDLVFGRDYGGQYEAPIWRDEA